MEDSLKYEQLVRARVLQQIDEVLADFGCDPHEELAKFGYTPDYFNSGNYRFQLAEVGVLLEHCVKVTGSRQCIFEIAAKQDHSWLGDLGLLLRTAPTLGDALRIVPEYLHIHVMPATWDMSVSGSLALWNFEIDSEHIPEDQLDLIVDLSVFGAWEFLKSMTDDQISLEFVNLRRSINNIENIYWQRYGVPTRCNSPSDGFALKLDNLSLKTSHANAQLHQMVKKQIDESAIHRRGTSLAQKVSFIIRALLPHEQCSFENVARSIGSDKRTLQRQLRRSANTTYQELLDDVRFELSEFYLRQTDIPITQVAYTVGFSDPSNFSRAFKARFGCSPRAWRNR